MRADELDELVLVFVVIVVIADVCPVGRVVGYRRVVTYVYGGRSGDRWTPPSTSQQ